MRLFQSLFHALVRTSCTTALSFAPDGSMWNDHQAHGLITGPLTDMVCLMITTALTGRGRRDTAELRYLCSDCTFGNLCERLNNGAFHERLLDFLMLLICSIVSAWPIPARM
ncbi:hypothetical protein EJ03DRAFT_41456 [Teratosphaeria nubilosa]|uniref:Secreted protein n=1 Tax=Teratosphaeria nubilosa TaxID=161662 RepID=A0A6G1KVN4_9PEZI|nr:hypothetical protein EJ03DRAFT_41456 [Teratosphaeria nubilosa]